MYSRPSSEEGDGEEDDSSLILLRALFRNEHTQIFFYLWEFHSAPNIRGPVLHRGLLKNELAPPTQNLSAHFPRWELAQTAKKGQVRSGSYL